jgi:hypothetical protein
VHLEFLLVVLLVLRLLDPLLVVLVDQAAAPLLEFQQVLVLAVQLTLVDQVLVAE